MLWTFKERVASFVVGATRRASNTRGKATKATKWPHKFLLPEQLSEAGFYYNPAPKQNDNVTCFLCQKSIVGWEEEDNPIHEHLKLSPDCGWAIIVSIQARNEDLLNEYPASERMVEARAATFADRWPHEEKKGWKCKTKQLVDAGWSYQPTPESDDWVTCAYCDLGLDGWEPADDPMEQHSKRNPGCTFFTLMNDHPDKPTTKKKPVKARKPRASKASRLSEMSQISISETSSARPARQSRATRASTVKDDNIESSLLVPEPEDDDFQVKIPAKKRVTRGRKRNSEELGAEAEPDAEPKAKRRNTRARQTSEVRVDDSAAPSFLEQSPILPPSKSPIESRGRKQNSDVLDEPAAKEPTKPKRRNTRVRQASTLRSRANRDAEIPEPASEPAPILPPRTAQSIQITGREPSPILPPKLVQKPQPKESSPIESPEPEPEPEREPEPEPEPELETESEAEPEPEPMPIPKVDAVPDFSESAQSSDAENQPPTPVMMSPAKRNNIITDIRSTQTWTATDIDDVFQMAMGGTEDVSSVLTSSEKAMTVESWIRYNAGVAEDKLKSDCERMVGLFEQEGGRAMRALQGVYSA